MPSDSDVQPGDALVTDALADGIYPPGLPVAVVTAVERQGATAFLRIDSQPVEMQGTRHVLVLTPRNSVWLPSGPLPRNLATLSQSNADAKKKARDDKSAQRRATPQPPRGRRDSHDHAAWRAAFAPSQPLVYWPELVFGAGGEFAAHQQLDLDA